MNERIAELLAEGYTEDQARAMAIAELREVGPATARIEDDNGFFTIERQPISCVGVFDYAGYRLPPAFELNPDELYPVLRSPAALSDPEFLQSLQLLPWIDDHTMLGPTGVDNRTPAEVKGVQGVTGQHQLFDADAGVLYSNVKCFSETQRDAIDSGKKELSLGYICKYLDKPGEWQGQPYRFIQFGLRGNHLASVDEGRMGSLVAVLDSTDPQRENTTMDYDVSTMTLDELAALIAAAKEAQDKLNAAGAGDDPAGDDPAADPAGDLVADEGDDPTKVPGTDADDDKKQGEGQDDEDDRNMGADGGLTTGSDPALDPTLPAAPGPAGTPGAPAAGATAEGTAEDAADRMFRELSRRDNLAKRLKPFIGVFDHSAMRERQVAELACRKLKIPAAKGREVAAVNAYLHNRPAPAARTSLRAGTGMDSRDTSWLDKQLEGRS